MTVVSNLVDLLDHASRAPRAAGFWFGVESRGQRAPAPSFVPYAEISERSAEISAALEAQGLTAGDRLAFSVPRLSLAISLWFGCLRSGIVAVPIREPLTAAEAQLYKRLVPEVLAQTEARALVVTSRTEALLQASAIDIPMFMLDARAEPASSVSRTLITPEHAALVQVPLQPAPEPTTFTHAQLLEHIRTLSSAQRVSDTDVFVSWLPVFESNGLSSMLLPLFLQRSCALLSTKQFVRRPLSWLELIHDVRGTISYAPAQAYAFSAKRAEPEEVAQLDLSCWHTAGAVDAPIPLDIQERFTRTFRAASFEAQAFGGCAQPLKEPLPAETSYALSHGQRALWFLSRIAPESTSYNVPLCLRITSRFDGDLLRRALQLLVARHDALRSVYPMHDGEPRRALLPPEAALDFQKLAVAELDESRLMKRVMSELEQPFDLATGPLFRAKLLVRGPEDAVLLLVMHHINVDGSSIMQIALDLWTAYEALARGAGATLPAPEHSYDDFVRWQAELLAGEQGTRLRAYWREQLRAAPRAINLYADRPRPARRSERGGTVALQLSAATSGALRELARQHDTTLYTVLLAIYSVLLHTVSGDDELLIATPALGRSAAAFRGLVGYFVNSLPIRARVGRNQTFPALVAQLRTTVLAALDHQDLPYSLIVEDSQPERRASHLPLCQVLFQLHGFRPDERLRTVAKTYGSDTRAQLGSLTANSVELLRDVAQFELALELNEFADNVAGRLTYCTDRFERATGEWLAGEFVRLAERFALDPARNIPSTPRQPSTSQRLHGAVQAANIEL